MIAATRAQCESTNKNNKYQHNPRQLVLPFYSFNYSRISPSSNSFSAEKTPCTSEKFLLSSAITSSVIHLPNQESHQDCFLQLGQKLSNCKD